MSVMNNNKVEISVLSKCVLFCIVNATKYVFYWKVKNESQPKESHLGKKNVQNWIQTKIQ